MVVIEVGTVTVEIVAQNQPKTSRFQKVTVPCVFTRGRWRCCDFPDGKPPEELKYSRISFSNTAKHIMDGESEAPGQTVADPPCLQPIVSSTNLTAVETESSSTIVVTSVRPAPGTPLHHNDSSTDFDNPTSPTPTFEIIRQVVAADQTDASSIQSGDHGPTITCQEAHGDDDLLQVIEHFGYSMPAVCATHPNAALQSFQQQSLPIRAMTKQPGARDLARVANLDNLDLKSQMPLLGALKSPGPRTPTKSSPRERMASVEELDIGLYRLSLSNRRDNVLTPPSTPQDERVARGPLFEYCAHSEGSPLLKIPPNTPCTPYRNNIPNLKVSDLPNDPRPRPVPYMSPNREGSEAATVSVLAIDNKIEQAMDLVKTHLTFAVREEVEVLRATIVELENRLRNLEVENVVLRQILPSEVVTSLVASGSLDPSPPTTTVPDTIAASNLATMIQAQQARQAQIARQENVPPKEPEF